MEPGLAQMFHGRDNNNTALWCHARLLELPVLEWGWQGNLQLFSLDLLVQGYTLRRQAWAREIRMHAELSLIS